MFINPVSTDASYRIPRSLRFKPWSTTNLYRLPTATGNRLKWTVSVWCKRAVPSYSGHPALFSAGPLSTYDTSVFFVNDVTLQFYTRTNGVLIGNILSTPVYRDVTAWMHVVVVYDSANATANDRMILYVNGARIALSTNSQPALNAPSEWNNSANYHRIGSIDAGAAYFFDGHMADFQHVDGQALTPSAFGRFDPVTGVWNPKQYVGAFGAQGFWLSFANNATVANLGLDDAGGRAGAGAGANHFVAYAYSVTADSSNDSLVDTPTNYGNDTGLGGEVRGNYCTLNKLDCAAAANIAVYGTLGCSSTNASAWGSARSTFWLQTGKWYWESVVGLTGGALIYAAGLWGSSIGLAGSTANIYPGLYYDSYSYRSDAQKANNNTHTAYGATFTNGDVIGTAYDADAGTITFYKNGVSQGVAFTGVSSYSGLSPAVGLWKSSGTADLNLNFGQRPFAYPAPAGFKAVCTQNLPEPTIKRGDDAMAINGLRVGTGAAFTVTGLRFKPDVIWTKNRGFAHNHILSDSVRGTQAYIIPDLPDFQYIDAQMVTAFNADGFSGGTHAAINGSTYWYVDWMWKLGAQYGMTAVNYLGNGSTQTIAHALGATPTVAIIKNLTSGYSWIVYHQIWGGNQYLLLDTADPLATATGWFACTSTNFTVGNFSSANLAGNGYIAYLFRSVPGYSMVNCFVVANGLDNGAFMFTGFRPRWVMVKGVQAAVSWCIMDAGRETDGNPLDYLLVAEANIAEITTPPRMDFLANGFKLRTSQEPNYTASAAYAVMAFAEHPFKYARAR